ncbi:MAG: hypothetical protein HUJ29_02930 [Gammaproteobacteria bacterium]|nr:hypothetical protein [Gammaproteobacteria bacterium]
MSANTVHIYTTADAVLDLPETEILDPKAGITSTGRPFRKVAVPEDEHNLQLKQYISQLESALDEQEFKVEVQFGNIIPMQQ